MPKAPATSIVQSIEWVATGLRLDLARVPLDPALLVEWAEFWRGLRVRLQAPPALATYLRQHMSVVLDTKAFSPNEQRMFAGPVHVECSLDEVESDLLVEDVPALASGTLHCSIRIRFDLTFANEEGIEAFSRLVRTDPDDVWERLLLYGPAAVPPELDGATSSVRLVGTAR